MHFSEYQEKSQVTAVYPNKGNNFVYTCLGLSGESGEIADKAKKIIRDDNNVISEDKKEEMKKELGDVLWYLSQVATEFGLTLEDIADTNLEKLSSRAKRGKISGSGDNR